MDALALGLPLALRDQMLGSVYTGLLTNRCRSCFAWSTSAKQWGARLGVYARDTLTSFQVVWPNWYTQSDGEHATGAATTITASIEYPAGTFTQIKFGGATQGSIVSGANIISDLITVAIPWGAKFWVRTYMTNANGMYFVGGSNIPFGDMANGDGLEYGASGITDKTMSGTIGNTDSNGGFACPPLGIIGPTRRPSFAILGDSRATGIMDHWGNFARERGPYERGLGPNFAVTNLSQSSESANTFNGSAGALRRAFANAYPSDLPYLYGTNDLGSSATYTRAQAGWALFPTKRVWGGTLDPLTTSSDSWATIANQTVGANETERINFNIAIRAQPSPLAGVIDTAEIAESSWNSGKWDVKYTVDASQYVSSQFDGTHHTALLARQLAASPAFAPTRFRRGQVAY